MSKMENFKDFFKLHCPESMSGDTLNLEIASVWAHSIGLMDFIKNFPENPKDWTYDQVQKAHKFCKSSPPKVEELENVDKDVRSFPNGNYFRIHNNLMYGGLVQQKNIRKGCASPMARIAAYNAITVRANKNQQCWGSFKDIAELAGMSVSTAGKAVHDLAFLGIIRLKKRFKEDKRQDSYLYTLLNIDKVS